jgi:hypothetical protein
LLQAPQVSFDLLRRFFAEEFCDRGHPQVAKVVAVCRILISQTISFSQPAGFFRRGGAGVVHSEQAQD